MKIVVNGILRDATEEEQKELEALAAAVEQEEPQAQEPLMQMVEDMAAATTLAQLRAAAKKFLISTD